MCELSKLDGSSPIYGLKLITDDFTDSSKLWHGTDDIFEMKPGQYMETTAVFSPQEKPHGQIIGMYITEDVFVGYRRNDDASVFEPIWTYTNEYKDSNKGVWSLKIKKSDGTWKLDGKPDGAGPDAPYQVSFAPTKRGGPFSFRIKTFYCPYIGWYAENTGPQDFLPYLKTAEYCKTHITP